MPASEPLASFLAEKDPDWYLTQAVEEILSGDTGGTILSNDENTQIDVPPNATSGEVTFTFEPKPSPDYDTGALSFASESFKLTAESGGVLVTVFSQPLVITLHYDEQNLGDILEDSLALYYWDEIASKWEDVVNTCPNGEYTRNLDDH